MLRDTDADMSLTVMADVSVIGRLEPPLAEGQRLLVNARADFYTGRGRLSMRAREIRAGGLGQLLEQLERLRATLAAEGLFDPSRKKPLPFLPRRIGLICGRASAAMEDVLVNARERWPGMAFEVREVPVQGTQAVSAVMGALSDLEAIPDVDVIILARGGGSVEDLLPFSNEALVRAVAACRTPIVSAIGHEQDAPLVDYVADLRASTPTDAAKRVVPSLVEQIEVVARLRQRTSSVVGNLLDREVVALDTRRSRARAIVSSRLDSAHNDITHLAARVRALSPAATLERGYAIVLAPDGSIVRASTDTVAGDLLDIRVAAGRLQAQVTSTVPH